MKKALLISMPFGALGRPAIGISLLKAQLVRRGLACDVRYLHLFYAELVGAATYRELSDAIPTSSLFGDWLFREDLFGPDPERDREYLDHYLPKQYPGAFQQAQMPLYLDCRALTTPFLEACMARIPWTEYGVVGFTSTFQQTVASLALARRIKASSPDIKICMGGANFEGEMGRELHARFGFVDYVFSGESDVSFPTLADSLLRQPAALPPSLPGVSGRSAKSLTVVGRPSEMIENLDTLPFPDYSDFVDALRAHKLEDAVPVQFLIETSRGCWWGEKHHCTFCGLNGESMKYRSKSADRVVAELSHLAAEYKAQTIWGTDNILDTRYFRTVLPTIKALGLDLNLFFETKANLRKDQLKLMKEVGLNWFQPGIESLNSHVLSLMDKGTTALQNVQLLKWVRQYRMLVTWNILIGFPGETAEDYERMAQLCESIVHLQPPSGAHPIRLDRFSPYFNAPEKYGIVNMKPFDSYRYVYPFNDESLRRIAYFFVFEYVDAHDPIKVGTPMLKSISRWCQSESLCVFYAVPGEHVLLLYDGRPFAGNQQMVLAGIERDIYLYCDAVRSFSAIAARATSYGDSSAAWSESQTRAFLAQMVEQRLMAVDDAHYLSLAVLADQESDFGPFADPRKPPFAASAEVAPL